MVTANMALSDGRIADAIRNYTEVLYNLSPGNVCAFLNRSLAYLEDGDYELAVVDAYRAGLAASELRKVRVFEAACPSSRHESQSRRMLGLVLQLHLLLGCWPFSRPKFPNLFSDLIESFLRAC